MTQMKTTTLVILTFELVFIQLTRGVQSNPTGDDDSRQYEDAIAERENYGWNGLKNLDYEDYTAERQPKITKGLGDLIYEDYTAERKPNTWEGLSSRDSVKPPGLNNRLPGKSSSDNVKPPGLNNRLPGKSSSDGVKPPKLPNSFPRKSHRRSPVSPRHTRPRTTPSINAAPQDAGRGEKLYSIAEEETSGFDQSDQNQDLSLKPHLTSPPEELEHSHKPQRRRSRNRKQKSREDDRNRENLSPIAAEETSKFDQSIKNQDLSLKPYLNQSSSTATIKNQVAIGGAARAIKDKSTKGPLNDSSSGPNDSNLAYNKDYDNYVSHTLDQNDFGELDEYRIRDRLPTPLELKIIPNVNVDTPAKDNTIVAKESQNDLEIFAARLSGYGTLRPSKKGRAIKMG